MIIYEKYDFLFQKTLQKYKKISNIQIKIMKKAEKNNKNGFTNGI